MINTQCNFRAAVFTLLTFPDMPCPALPCTEELLRYVRFCCTAARNAVAFVWKSVVKTLSLFPVWAFRLFAGPLSCCCEGTGQVCEPLMEMPGPWPSCRLHRIRESFLLPSLAYMSLWKIFLDIFINEPGFEVHIQATL